MRTRTTRTLIGSLVALTLTLGVGVGVAAADDHLANGATSNGAETRGFNNPVAGNPSGTAGATAQPATVPSLGNPNAGEDEGTPAFSCGALQNRLEARSNGTGPGC